MRAPGQYAGTNNEKHACVSVSLVYGGRSNVCLGQIQTEAAQLVFNR